jgi:uncharacterized protein YceK
MSDCDSVISAASPMQLHSDRVASARLDWLQARSIGFAETGPAPTMNRVDRAAMAAIRKLDRM